MWLLVQRKWMYLESIFIGGDIRVQLPEEAANFDTIDKKFKDVSVVIILILKKVLCFRHVKFMSFFCCR